VTTEELLRLIEQQTARHRHPSHDPAEEHPNMVCAVTIGNLFPVAGVPRRTIEEAIQTARLEGVPIITDGGIRVAQDSAEAMALYRWLRARLVTQQRTAWAVRSQALLMARAERRRAAEAAEQPTLWGVAA